MSHYRHNFVRVTHRNRCPICGKPDWCMMTTDRSAAICARIESQKRVGRKEFVGFWHDLGDSGATRVPTLDFQRRQPHPGESIDWQALTDRYSGALTPERGAAFGKSLGLTTESLKRLCVGWCAPQQAYAFPMRDATGKSIGFRLRRPNGFKFAVTGSRQGIFLPADLIGISLAGQQLFVAEGPTDTGALLDLGFAAVGRPSCRGGTGLLQSFVRSAHPSGVVIVADGDRPGQEGAHSLAAMLSQLYVELRIVTPPAGIKDAREWIRRGATAADVLTAPVSIFSHPAIRRAQEHAVQHRAKARRHSR